MRVTQKMMVDNVRANISVNAENLSTLQDQLSSGKRIRRPSDDPQALSRALTLKEASDQNAQYMRNLVSARGWLEATDTALEHLSGVLLRARSVALRGTSGTLGTDEWKALSKQVDGLLEEMVQALGSTHDGKQLFSGRRVTTRPFEPVRDPTTNQITSVGYAGDSGEVRRDLGGDAPMIVNVSGDVRLGGRAVLQEALSGLIDLRDRLSGVSGAPTAAHVEQITTSLDGVATLRGTVGAKMNRVDATESATNQVQNNLAAMLSRAQDADIAEVITKLAMQENVYRAALAAGARIIQPSLLDFLR